MTSIKSVNNASNVPLASGKTFIGKYDSVLEFSTAVVLVNSDRNCELTLYQSADKLTTYTQVFSPVGGSPFTQVINLTAPYCSFTLKNTSGSDMTFLSFEVIYRQVSVIPPAGSAQNVNIHQSNGDNIAFDSNGTLWTNVRDINPALLDNGNLKVAVENYPNVYIVGVNNDGAGNLDVNMNASAFNDGNDNLKVAVQGTPSVVIDGVNVSGTALDVNVANQSAILVSEQTLDACIANNFVNMSLQDISATYLDNGSLRVIVENPSAIATDTTLSAITTTDKLGVGLYDSNDNAISTTVVDSKNALDVNVVVQNSLSSYYFTSGTAYQAFSVSGNSQKLHNVLIATDGGPAGSQDFIKIYDTAQIPDVTTDTPVLVFQAQNNFPPTFDIQLANGFGCVVSGGIAPTDTTALNHNQAISFVYS